MDSIKLMQITPAFKQQVISSQNKPANTRHSPEDLEKIKKTCADFEAIFNYELIKSMRRTIPEQKTGMNFGKDSYMMIIDQKLAENMSSNNNGLGLQEILFDHFTKTNFSGR